MFTDNAHSLFSAYTHPILSGKLLPFVLRFIVGVLSKANSWTLVFFSIDLCKSSVNPNDSNRSLILYYCFLLIFKTVNELLDAKRLTILKSMKPDISRWVVRKWVFLVTELHSLVAQLLLGALFL